MPRERSNRRVMLLCFPRLRRPATCPAHPCCDCELAGRAEGTVTGALALLRSGRSANQCAPAS